MTWASSEITNAMFKTHSRSDPRGAANMWPVAHTLTDKQIDGLAKHFAAQKPDL
jgi:cytochrome c553